MKKPAGKKALSFVLYDRDGFEVFRQTMARQFYPGIVVWGGRAFRLNEIQSAYPEPARYTERETFVIGRDT